MAEYIDNTLYHDFSLPRLGADKKDIGDMEFDCKINVE